MNPLSRKLSLLALAFGLVLCARTARSGSVGRLYYDGISTPSSPNNVRFGVATLTNSTLYPNGATYREQLDDFSSLPGQPLRAGLQGKDNSGQDYGSFIRGYLEAPATGVYLFNVASDDNSSFYLSTNHLPAGKRLVAYELESGAPLFGGPRQETRLSAPISLVRGQKYYFEVLHKQGGGGSYVQVGWQRPDGVQEIIPALHLAQYQIDPFLGTGSQNQPPTFNVRGRNSGNLTNVVSVAEGSELLLELDVIAAQPTTFVWKKNGVVIPGENLSFLRIPYVPGNFNGAVITAEISNDYGSLISAPTTLTVTPDVTAPSVLAVETGGNPNLLTVTFSEPVDPITATSLANYEIRPVGGSPFVIQSASILPGAQAVEFSGEFNFETAVSYQVTVRDVRDQATAPNTLVPNPTVTAFNFSAPIGTTYNFNNGRPSGFRFFGFADVTNNPTYAGGGFLQLTDAFRNRTGTILLTDRREVDQVRLRFKTRISDGGYTNPNLPEAPGDGFSINIAGDLPLGTIGNAEEGFTPDVPGNRLSFAFDTRADSSLDFADISVIWNNQVLTNILTGTNGIPRNGVPSVQNTDGHWADVDIDLRRNGLLTLRFDGVTLLNNWPTPFETINNGQINFAARTRSAFQTHWIDDLNVNYGEGDVGNVSLASESVLGGTFLEGSQVRLSALPLGAGPFRYQWFKNGAPLAGENGRLLRFPATLDAGGNYSIVVSNAFSSFTSSPTAVVIQPDVQPPQIVQARGVAGGVNRVYLSFNELLDPLTATDPSVYTSPFFLVSSASLTPDGAGVVLQTTALRAGFSYPLNIAGLRDRSSQNNALTTTLNVSSSLTYKDEVLADAPTRYFRFNETAGTVALTETSVSDQTSTNASYVNNPTVGVPGLVPSAVGEKAAFFDASKSNYVAVPNGGDINDLRGPWSQKSYEFWLRARTTPAPTNRNSIEATAGIYEEGGNLRGIQWYLWRDPANTNVNESDLVFHGYNDTPDGPGSPFGLRANPPTWARYKITAGTVYHVVGVFDGRTDSRDGELRLYINGEFVAKSTNGVGQIYNHNGDIRIAWGNARTHFDVSANLGYFDGTIDDFSLYNTVLSPQRIRDHYRAGTGASLSGTNPPTLVDNVNPRGNPNQLTVTFNQPVSAATATSLANYTLKTAGGTIIPIQSAVLQKDLVSVRLNGAFNFQSGSSYNVTVKNVADILVPANVVAQTTVPFTFVSQGPVGISLASDLGDKSVIENSTVQFSVVATGEPPFSYQWRRNGVPLAGQTQAALSISAPLTAAGDYSVVVSNEFSGVISLPAHLTVLPDAAPPQVVSVRGLAGSLNEVRLLFNEPVDLITAERLSTYSLTGLTILNASRSEDGLEVTLETSPQTVGQTNRVTISGLRDLAFSPNALNTTARFVSGIYYRDEVLADGAVRYWTLGETAGPLVNTLTYKFDVTTESRLAVVTNGAVLGVPGLVPNVGNDTAISFAALATGGSTSNRIEVRNGRDINAILGPWAKRSYSFTFKADHLPNYAITNIPGTNAVGTNILSPAIFAHGRVAFYLYGIEDTANPTNALLIFTAHNNASEGPGSPWGNVAGSTVNAKFVSVPITTGQVYQVVGVLDGDPAGYTGQLKLYVNGQLVGFTGGIGALYKHPNNTPTFGQGGFLRHDGVNQTLVNNAPFEGVVDEFAIIPAALSAGRIAELYGYSQAPPAFSGTASRISSIVRQGNNLIITWDGGGQLQRASAVNGPYVPVQNATSPSVQPITGNAGYFRVVIP